MRHPVGLLHPAQSLMRSPLDTLFRLPANMLETGLLTMNTGLRAMQAAIETVTGQFHPGEPKAPPLDGPKDIDTAVSDFANRIARIARYTPWEASEMGAAAGSILEAIKRSFGYVD